MAKTNKTIQGCEEREASFTIDGMANWCSHWEKLLWRNLKRLKINLPQHPLIPLLGTYTKDSTSYPISTCTATFIAVLFTVTRTWKDPKIPSTTRWIIYILLRMLQLWRRWNHKFCMKMGRNKKMILSDINWTQKDKQYILSHLRLLAPNLQICIHILE